MEIAVNDFSFGLAVWQIIQFILLIGFICLIYFFLRKYFKSAK